MNKEYQCSKNGVEVIKTQQGRNIYLHALRSKIHSASAMNPHYNPILIKVYPRGSEKRNCMLIAYIMRLALEIRTPACEAAAHE